MISKLLIANRGEIACRIIHSARSLGIRTVAVYSAADEQALHVELADEAVPIGPAPATQSYLRTDAILDAARATGADAIHPGYGFLSENPDFAEAVAATGLIFVGPSAQAIRAMGLKDHSKKLMEQAGVPVVQGYHGQENEPDFLAGEAQKIGYPVLIKARAGGGGKGMRLVECAADFAEALASCRREAEASFGDAHCLIEKFIQSPRHIEVQVFGDDHGNIVHLFERDCSLQRRHQKVIEEAPAPGMTPQLRAAMGAAAVAAARAVNYSGAGTVEFIVDGARFPKPDAFWFMEMNTRLQVEHPVTELVTGHDLVALQLSVAGGAPLPFAQDDLSLMGHAVEARLYAEDAATGFLPVTGPLTRLNFAKGAGIRIDTGVRQGDLVSPHYDPMIAKVIAHGPDRATAICRLKMALSDTRLAGTVTNRAFLVALLGEQDVRAGQVDTGLIGRNLAGLTKAPPLDDLATALAALALLRPDPTLALPGFRLWGAALQSVVLGAEPIEIFVSQDQDEAKITLPERVLTITQPSWHGERVNFQFDGRFTQADVLLEPQAVHVQLGSQTIVVPRTAPGKSQEVQRSGAIISPMPGLVSRVGVAAGDKVTKGAPLVSLEAMKMEHALTAPREGIVAEVRVAEGQQVAQGDLLLSLEPEH